jgi:hypothetical protein
MTPGSEGNRHILVIIDTFSRFVELVPTDALNMKVVAKALFTHMGRYIYMAPVRNCYLIEELHSLMES